MASHIRIYTKTHCPYSARARELLNRKGLHYEEIDLLQQPHRRDEMIDATNGRTSVPQIFVGGRHLGGCDDLIALDDSGEFDRILESSGAEASP